MEDEIIKKQFKFVCLPLQADNWSDLLEDYNEDEIDTSNWIVIDGELFKRIPR